MRQGPLAGRYPAVAAMVTLALIPYLALSAALDPLVPIISEQLHITTQAMSLSSGLGNAAYAVGTVLAVQFAQHLPQRRMLLVYSVALVVGSVLAAAAPNAGTYICGHVLQGLAISTLLIAAAPPLMIGYPEDKLRHTAVIRIYASSGRSPSARSSAGCRLQRTRGDRCSGSSPRSR
jgi:predicted MFS family arabinose efflux permease